MSKSIEFTGVVAIFDIKPSGGTVDLKFKDLPIDQVEEFLRWVGTDEGIESLGDSLINALVTAGVFTRDQIEAAQEGG